MNHDTEELSVLICSQCGSTNSRKDGSLLQNSWITSQRYSCDKCHYVFFDIKLSNWIIPKPKEWILKKDLPGYEI